MKTTKTSAETARPTVPSLHLWKKANRSQKESMACQAPGCCEPIVVVCCNPGCITAHGCCREHTPKPIKKVLTSSLYGKFDGRDPLKKYGTVDVVLLNMLLDQLERRIANDIRKTTTHFRIMIELYRGPQDEPVLSRASAEPTVREIGCLEERAAHARHTWVPANDHQKELWQCAKSPKCKGDVVKVCSHRLCGLGYCAEHILHAPQISTVLGLSVTRSKAK